MKTAHDKAEDAVELWITGNLKSSLSEIICRALKEQDRDTRHACADKAIGVIGRAMAEGLIEKGQGQGIADAVYDACMNATEV